MSKHTVVSLLNYKPPTEYKPLPAYFEIPQAGPNGIGCLVVDDRETTMYLPGTSNENQDMKTIQIPVLAKDLAESIVEDYCRAQLCLGDGAKPGLFHVPGEWEPEDIPIHFPELIEEASARYYQWAKNLVKMADDLWAVHKQHRHISQSMIDAAKLLKLSREWAAIPSPENFIECPNCGVQLKKTVASCFNCKCVIDATKFAALEFA